MFAVNARFRAHRVTGMQRYAIEICRRFSSAPDMIGPQSPLIGLKGHLWEQTVLPSLLKGRLLWSPCNTGPVYAKRHVITIHDLIPLEHPEWYGKRFAALYKALMPNLARHATHIIAVSEFTKQRVIELLGIAEKKITVVSNGVGAEFVPQSAETIARLRQSLGIPPIPYLLSVCSLEPRKNLGRLLSAWSLSKERRGDAVLVVAGAKGDPSVFKQSGIESIPEGVLFTGYVPDADLPALYSGATALIYPSLYEGFGLPVVEALATGTPVIASTASSIPEVAGPNAVLIDPMNPSEMAEAIVHVLNRPSGSESVEAFRRHASNYTWSSAAKTTEALLASYA